MNKSTTDDKDADDVNTSGESNSHQPQVKEQKEKYLLPFTCEWKGYLAWYRLGCMTPKSKRLAIFDGGKTLNIFMLHAMFHN